MSTTKQTSAHKSILKSTGVFGSVKLFKIFSSIITTKFAAIYLGPSGVGILGLLKSVIGLIASITSFGFSITGIKEIAKHSTAENQNNEELEKTITTLKYFALSISVIGCLVTVIFSKKLSLIIFKNTNDYLWVILLSLNYFFVNYNIFLGAILQGLRKIKLIAWSGIVSSILIVVSTIPCYYWLGLKGIVPAILLANFLGLLVNIFFVKKIKLSKTTIGFTDFFQKAKELYKLGFLLSLNVIFGFITKFLIKLYLENYGASEATLGYYEASIVILTSYFGIIFSSMSIDYYPKLTSIRNSNRDIQKLVNKQIEIALLLVTPLIVIMYTFSKIVLNLMYSNAFEKVETIFIYGLLAIVFKAIIWPLGFIILAKDDKRQYFYQELFGDFVNIMLSILLYRWLGLLGLGLALFLNFGFSITYIYHFIHKKYQFEFDKEVIVIFFISILLASLACVVNFYCDGIVQKIILGVLILISSTYSIRIIDKKTDLIKTVKQKLRL